MTGVQWEDFELTCPVCDTPQTAGTIVTHVTVTEGIVHHCDHPFGSVGDLFMEPLTSTSKTGAHGPPMAMFTVRGPTATRVPLEVGPTGIRTTIIPSHLDYDPFMRPPLDLGLGDE